MVSMARKHQISYETRVKVVSLHEAGFSQRKIVRMLNGTGISLCGVQTTLQRYKETGSFEDRNRSGRPPKTTARDDRNLVMLSMRNRRATSRDLTAQWNRAISGVVDPSTVRRRLLKAGLRGCVAKKKPLVSEKNRKERLKYARKHCKWGKEEWGKVLWSDESTFQLFPTKGRVWVRRHANERYKQECLAPTVKHGGEM